MKAKTIKLGMDVRMIEHSGIGVRIRNILKFWKDRNDIEIYLFGNPDTISAYPLPLYKEIIPYRVPIYSVREWLGHPRMREMDLLDIPHFNAPLVYIQRCQVTIHDLIPYVMKQYHSSPLKRLYLHLVLPRVLKHAHRILTVSEYTRKDILRVFPGLTREIQVAPNGIDHALYRKQPQSKVETFRRKYNLPKHFFLTVGIGKGHKNQEFLLECMQEEWRRNPNLGPLAIAGTGGVVPEYLRQIYEKIPNRLLFLPRIDEVEMPLLYQACDLLIYPSLYEGFGFPVAEASAVSTLVLSSNATVLPEVLGEGAIFFNPYSKEDFSEKFHTALLLSSSERRRLLKLSKERVRTFRWEKTVERIQDGIAFF